MGTNHFKRSSIQQHKMLRLVLLSLCVCLSLQKATKSEDGGWVKPSFCKTNDCPRYAVLEQGEGYELRQYEEAMWVSTEAESIDGNNANGEKIAMTSPVLNKITPGPGPNCESMFKQSFYVPDSHQENAPAPSAENVYLEKMAVMTVYVKSFGGYATEDD